MLISVEDNFYECKSKTGHVALGGEDFENAIMDFCISSFKVSTGLDISKNSKACVRLKRECATALRSLSVSKSVEVFVESISEGEDLEVDISREVFEEMCDDKFRICVKAIDKVLAQFKKYDKDKKLDHIVLGGFATIIPGITNTLRGYFNN